MNNPSFASAAPAKNRKQFYIVLGMFVAPLMLAFAVYYGSSWRPTNTTNKGDLVTPAVPLPIVTLTQADGTPTGPTFLRDTWALVYVGKGECGAICRTALNSTRNARLLLGKDITRVDRTFLFTGTCCDAGYFGSEQIGLTSANVDSDAGQALLKLIPDNKGVSAIEGQHIYIVDPLGNLMMSYAADVDPRWIYQDLKKLLKLSHIG